jgi:D-arabinonate dehydratase
MRISDITITGPLYLDLGLRGTQVRGDAKGSGSGPTGYAFFCVSTDEGITGICPGFASSDILAFLDIYRPLVVGEDPFEVEKIWEKLYWTNYGSVRRGAPMRALSYVDTAIWDIIAKACKQPIHRLLGGHRTKVPAYGSGINWFLTIDELIKQNRTFLDMGFKMVKMKIGQRDIRDDLMRIKAVRDVVGNDIDIAVDGNNTYGVSTAINIAKKMERYDIYWFEEPVLLDNVEGIVKLAKSTSIPIAGYELENTKYAFKELIARGAIGICQADAMICGGITEWRKIAALAECYGIPMAPHAADWIHVPLTAAIPHGLNVEWIWPSGADPPAELLKDPIVPKDGMMECKTIPGIGVEFTDETVKKYSAKPTQTRVYTLNPHMQWPPYA